MASAQIVSVGVKGGVPTTPAVADYFTGPTHVLDTGRWTVGPTIEFRLPFGFSVEADALYRGYREHFSVVSDEFIIPAGFNVGATVIPALFVSSQSGTKVWDFPLLLKYQIGSRRFRPFVGAGYAFSHRTTDATTFQTCLSSAGVCQAAPVYSQGTFRGSFTDNSSDGDGWRHLLIPLHMGKDNGRQRAAFRRFCVPSEAVWPSRSRFHYGTRVPRSGCEERRQM